jgi:hypothetical protein
LAGAPTLEAIMTREDRGSRTCADAGDWERSRDPGDDDSPTWADVDDSADGYCTECGEPSDECSCEVEGCTGVDGKVPCGCPHCTAKREAARAELDAGRPEREVDDE